MDLNSEGPPENIIEEAEYQWELAKCMGVHSNLDQVNIINKISEMEKRDRQEAEELGNKHISS